MPESLSTDVLIVGGGVAGLWLNARLRRLGFATLLVDKGALGGGQSVKSQGIIHGGTKYALSGALTGASEAIADMPRRWREALEGKGELDLSGVRLLSDAHYLWSPGTLAGNLTSFFASKAVRSRVGQVKGNELPPALQHPKFKGKVYRLSELVLDVPSLIARLAELAGDSLLACQRIEPLLDGNELVGLRVDGREIRAQRIVFSAGGGLPSFSRRSACNNRPCSAVRCTWSSSRRPRSSRSMPIAWAAAPNRGSRSPAIRQRTASGSGISAATWPKPMAWRATKPLRSPRRKGTGRTGALDRPVLRAMGHAAYRPRRACTIGTRPSGQRLPCRAGPTAGRVADQAGAVPDFSDRVEAALARDGIRPANHPALPQLPRPPLTGPFWEGLLP